MYIFNTFLTWLVIQLCADSFDERSPVSSRPKSSLSESARRQLFTFHLTTIYRPRQLLQPTSCTCSYVPGSWSWTVVNTETLQLPGTRLPVMCPCAVIDKESAALLAVLPCSVIVKHVIVIISCNGWRLRGARWGARKMRRSRAAAADKADGRPTESESLSVHVTRIAIVSIS